MIIATRTLHVKTEEGEKPVAIRIYMPTPIEPYDAEAPHWECRYEIDWPEGIHRFRMQGNDALDALYTALEKIGMDVHSSKYHRERRMWWLKSWVRYGFPMPKGARDELIGHDQKYLGLDEPQ